MIPPPAPLVRGQSPCTHRGSGPSPHFLPDYRHKIACSVTSCQVVSLGYQRVGCAGDVVVPAYVGGACVPTTLARRCGVSLWLRPRSGPEVSNYRSRVLRVGKHCKSGRRGDIGAGGGAYTETDPVPAVLAVGSCRSAPRVRTAGAGRGHSRPKSAFAMMKMGFTSHFCKIFGRIRNELNVHFILFSPLTGLCIFRRWL